MTEGCVEGMAVFIRNSLLDKRSLEDNLGCGQRAGQWWPYHQYATGRDHDDLQKALLYQTEEERAILLFMRMWHQDLGTRLGEPSHPLTKQPFPHLPI